MDNSAKSFYSKICAWIFFCLCLAPICSLVNTVKTNIEKAKNESSAVEAIESIRKLQYQYAAKNQGKFAPNFDELIKTGYLNLKAFRGQNPVVNDYVFEMKVTEPTAQKPAFYSITADPLYNEDNNRHFYFDSALGAIKMTDENRPANGADQSF